MELPLGLLPVPLTPKSSSWRCARCLVTVSARREGEARPQLQEGRPPPSVSPARNQRALGPSVGIRYHLKGLPLLEAGFVPPGSSPSRGASERAQSRSEALLPVRPPVQRLLWTNREAGQSALVTAPGTPWSPPRLLPGLPAPHGDTPGALQLKPGCEMAETSSCAKGVPAELSP